MFSKSQIDKLGERLKADLVTSEDLRMLDEYRESFRECYDKVFERLVDYGVRPTGRPSKSTTSIVDKLRRESIRLSQIQDIAGCRIVVDDLGRQELVAEHISHLFEKVTLIDRRKNPSNGYRAIHAIVHTGGRSVEVQIRTFGQHHWAEFSELLSDSVDTSIKYGGIEPISLRLRLMSDMIFQRDECLSMFDKIGSDAPSQNDELEGKAVFMVEKVNKMSMLTDALSDISQGIIDSFDDIVKLAAIERAKLEKGRH